MKIDIYNKKSYSIIRFLNKKSVIKKKFKNLVINKKDNKIILNNNINLISLNNYKNLINNFIIKLFKLKKNKQRLILEGIGYKVWKKKYLLRFKLGFSRLISINIPYGIHASIFKSKKILLFGSSLQKLPLFKNQIRLLKKPDPYKMKGVRFYNEIIKLKQGKKK